MKILTNSNEITDYYRFVVDLKKGTVLKVTKLGFYDDEMKLRKVVYPGNVIPKGIWTIAFFVEGRDR